MRLYINTTFSVFLGIAVIFASCHKNQHDKNEIEAAMKNYDRLLQKMDADSIAMLFTPDGDLGDQAHGRTWIKRYLGSFQNVHVLSQVSTTSSIEMMGDSSIHKGIYQQVDLISYDTIRVKGEFTVKWLWDKHERWLISSIRTIPIN
jgi:hypothetical protein